MSCDVFLGLPFNIASYALLTHMVAQICNLEVDKFVWTGGDVHLYQNHFEQARLQLSRHPMQCTPKLEIAHKGSIFDYEPKDISLTNYLHHPAIKAPVAV